MLEDVLRDWGAKELPAMEIYSDVFKLGDGEIQLSGEDQESHNMKANPLGYWMQNGSRSGHYRVFFEDTFEDTLEELQEADFAIINGVTYFGRRNLQASASKMYAMIFDLDGVTDVTLNNFLSGAVKADAYPVPNYIALSGHGIHLYYVFDEPISLYPNIKIQLKELKYALTDRMWNPYTSLDKKKQFQGINQGFRPVGGKTKVPGVRVRGFKLNEHPFTIGQLCEYVPDSVKVDEEKIYKESRLTLADAKKKYPEWYHRRIEQGEKLQGHWTTKRDLYDWWKRQIRIGATFHHRYFNLMCLAIYAVKAGIEEEELRKDAKDLMPFLNGIAPSDPFTVSDMRSALECYDERYVRFPIEDISRLSGIEIKKNKRNGLKQKQHLYLARRRKEDMKVLELALKAPEGRPQKGGVVTKWRSDHPEGRKADCIRDTGLDRKTVSKYWNTSIN